MYLREHPQPSNNITFVIKYDSNYDGTYDEKLKHARTILTSRKFLCSRYIQNKNSKIF